MHRASQEHLIAPAGGPSPSPWVSISGFGKDARWVGLGQTGDTDYRMVRSNGVTVTSWTAPAGAAPDTYFIPTDVQIEARRSSGAAQIVVLVQEGVTWPAR